MLTSLRSYQKTRKHFGTNLQDTQQGYQNHFLRPLVQRAYNEVPVYKKIYDEHQLDVDAIDTVEDLSLLPVITKLDFKKHEAKDQVSRKWAFEDLGGRLSSGSTGEPFTVYISPEDKLTRDLSTLHIYFQMGLSIFSKRGYFLTEKIVKSDYWFQKYNIWQQFPLYTFEDKQEAIQIIQDKKIDCLEGYPSIVALFAQYIKNEGIELPSVRLVLTHGEILTPEVRLLISESLQADVRDIYGTNETGHIGYECADHNGYHIDPNCIVEIMQDNQVLPEGEVGDIVVTRLKQHAMPFIRYNTQDLGAIDYSPCSCGLKSPRLTKIEGRSGNFFYDKNWQKTSPLNMLFAWNLIGEICRYQMIQNEVGLIDLHVLLNDGIDPEAFRPKLQGELDRIFGDRFDFNVIFEDDIAKVPGRKYCAMVPNIKESDLVEG